MALLDRIIQMKQRGLPEQMIIKTLMEEGNSFQGINEAISQSKVKETVTSLNSSEGEMQPSSMPMPMEQDFQIPEGEMQEQKEQVEFNQQQAQQYSPDQYIPQYSQQREQPMQQQTYPEQAYYPQDYSQMQPQMQDVYYQQAIDAETVRDIAKQVVEEDLQKIKQEMAETIKLKTELKFQIQSIDNRLIKIENVINELQAAILQRMGSYGEAISNISKEIHATQDSFSKMINPIVDSKRSQIFNQAQRQQNQQSNQQSIKPNKKSQPQNNPAKSSFEDYFR